MSGYVWLFQGDVCETAGTLEELKVVIKKAGGLQPNWEKGERDLEETGEFVYGCGQYVVRRVDN